MPSKKVIKIQFYINACFIEILGRIIVNTLLIFFIKSKLTAESEPTHATPIKFIVLLFNHSDKFAHTISQT